MNLRSLKTAIATALKSNTLKAVPASGRKVAGGSIPDEAPPASMIRAGQELPLASARDVGIFALFDLPPELVEAIVSAMVHVVPFYRAPRLRTVNSEGFMRIGASPIALTI